MSAAGDATAFGDSFVYQTAPQRLIFGPGARHHLFAELRTLQVERPFLATTKGQATRIPEDLRSISYGGRAEYAAMHTPTDVTLRALADMAACGADGIVSFGGGSATGLGKALAVRTGLPLIAVGTTYGGSEMTSLIGETQNGVKATRRDSRALPLVTIYDVELTLGLPPATSGASGLNALAHAVEATYAPDANPIVTALALDAIRRIVRALPAVVEKPSDVSVRAEALRGSCEAGWALNAVQMGLHHKLCHVLGGLFDLPHAETHAVLLPHAMAYNRPAVTLPFRSIAETLGCTDAVAAVDRLARTVAPVHSLRELGMAEAGIGAAVDLIMSNPYANPQPLKRRALTALLRAAWAGDARA